VDLSNPESPTILGQLKIPGFSDYLHPYNDELIIGLGKEVDYDEKEDTTREGGLKISLFDVSDFSNPREVSKIVVGERGTYSEALDNHKAFLFDKSKNLLVLPIREAEINYRDENDSWGYSDIVYQGAYVFEIDSEDGISMNGKISHLDEEDLLKSGYYLYSDKSILRSLFIGDSLYTISPQIVKANNFSDLSDISSLVLWEETEDDLPVEPLPEKR
ncbi:MAG: beta-propeller domain-containing protein, partial [Nanoarchaeota archaeon]